MEQWTYAKYIKFLVNAVGKNTSKGIIVGMLPGIYVSYYTSGKPFVLAKE